MKRKADEDLADKPAKKRNSKDINGSTQFREGLLQQAEKYRKEYTTSEPYKHGVIQALLDPQLLRNVRAEVQGNLSFTPKETDIYKIHQSGDLANLDGLDDSSLKLLPSLLILRNALYSPEFRDFLSTVTDSGPLSGKKTDMAINVYTPGCHLLCHDDVIGSRRVSYILYLTDPDQPWKPEWGGALRLFPTVVQKDEDGKEIKIPGPDPALSIPPAFNQLSFFAVQPGESYHDVEEVFTQSSGSQQGSDDARVRMAISGWYHIPQEGEAGFVKGLEESLAERSSLQQLQGSGDQFDMPCHDMRQYEDAAEKPDEQSKDEAPLSEKDLDFLLKFIAPTYLTPDTLESVSNTFADECSICLERFLSQKFSDSLKTDIVKQEALLLPLATSDIEKQTSWQMARPPYKHRFLYRQVDSQPSSGSDESPSQKLLTELLPSEAFRKWLQVATGLSLSSRNLTARRFRRGKDYTLATGYTKDDSQLELIMAITPSDGWAAEEEPAEDEKPATNEEPAADEKPAGEDADNLKEVDHATNATASAPLEGKPKSADPPGVGGYIAYIAGDEAGEHSDDGQSDDGVEVPLDLSTGARASRPSAQKKSNKKADPAIYQAVEDDENDGILFSMPAGWNTLGLVLRDKGVMRFVKYVSQQAKGDRWDILGEFGVDPRDDDGSVDGEIEQQQVNDETSETDIDTDYDKSTQVDSDDGSD
ncbi:MAG: hypothetical protein L6R36_005685 [Xanthoria steineri]|nr:MAG: hypothetical protein L6R36_005685 [Xanthoria steineri]